MPTGERERALVAELIAPRPSAEQSNALAGNHLDGDGANLDRDFLAHGGLHYGAHRPFQKFRIPRCLVTRKESISVSFSRECVLRYPFRTASRGNRGLGRMNESDACLALGLHEGADAAAIKAAFRTVALKCHPDHAPNDPGAAARFSQAKDAHDHLMTLSSIRSQRTPPPEEGSERRDGADIEVDFPITLEQAAGLAPAELRGGTGRSCHACSGTGRRPLSAPIVCSACSGDGMVRITRGLIRVRRPCAPCAGKGTVWEEACGSCGGSGVSAAPASLVVALPPGARDGDVIRVEGRGAPGAGGGSRGALRAIVRVLPHSLLRRKGDDLLSELRVSFADLCLGGCASVSGLGGVQVPFEIEPGTPSGGVVAVPDQGMPLRSRQGRGRLVVRLEAEVPVHLSEEQTSLIRRWRELEVG